MRSFALVLLAACSAAVADPKPDAETIPAAIKDTFGTTGAACKTIPCVRDAIAAKKPFVVDEPLKGIDSKVERAIVGVTENKDYVVYLLAYDSDPCGGSCSFAGGTTLLRCDKPPVIDAKCAGRITDCATCTGTVVDSWHKGHPLTAASKGAMGVVWGDKPATLGELFDGVAMGDKDPSADKLRKAARDAAMDGIDVMTQLGKTNHELSAVRISMPWHCKPVLDNLTKKWGAQKDNTWFDANKKVKATFDLAKCNVLFEML